jgi:hypothetical protein
VINPDGSDSSLDINESDQVLEIKKKLLPTLLKSYNIADVERLHLMVKPSDSEASDDNCKPVNEEATAKQADITQSTQLKVFLSSGNSDYWQVEPLSFPVPPYVDGNTVRKQMKKGDYSNDQSVKSKRAYSGGTHRWTFRSIGATSSSSIGVCKATFDVKRGIQGNASGYACYSCGGNYQQEVYSEGLLAKGGARDGDGVTILKKGLPRCHNDGEEIIVTLNCENHVVTFEFPGKEEAEEEDIEDLPQEPLYVFVSLSDVGHGWELLKEESWGPVNQKRASFGPRTSTRSTASIRRPSIVI